MYRNIFCILSLLLSMSRVIADESYPMTSLEVNSFPEIVTLGDSIYIQAYICNPHDESVYVPKYFSSVDTDFMFIRFILENHDTKREYPLLHYAHPAVTARVFQYVTLPPGAKREIGVYSFAVPALEDLHDPFWQDLNKDTNKEHVLTLRIVVNTKNKGDTKHSDEIIHTIEYKTKVKYRARNQELTCLMESWYEDTPKECMPTIGKRYKVVPPIEFWEDKTKQIERNGRMYDLLTFTTEYPGTPNWPKTNGTGLLKKRTQARSSA